MFKKKGSLNLSIEAIVIIVVAFVVLGLGLTLTRTIFKGAEQKLPEAFAVTQLESQPTAENPITIADKVEMGRNKDKELNIGYYNSDADNHLGVFLTITDCKASSAEAQAKINEDSTLLPSLTSITQDVGPSDSKAYKVILSENGLLGGFNYICTIAAVSSSTDIWESKQFFLYVTS